MSPHIMNAAMGEANKFQVDPGTGKAIIVNNYITWIPIVTAGAETNTLPDPPYGGQELFLWMKTDGGDRVITASTAFNSTGNNTITLNDAGDTIGFVSVPDSSGYRWEVMFNNGASLSTV